MKRDYFTGLVTGGFVGAMLGMLFARRQKSDWRNPAESRKLQERSKKVLRGISRGMMGVLRRH
jgi:gas vesicle protein